MAVARSWMLMGRGLRGSKGLRNRDENKEDTVNLDFSLDPHCLMHEILSNICKKHGNSSVKKLNYLNAFVHLLSKNTGWKSQDTFGFTIDEILICLRVALIQDSVQVRAVGLRALRYTVKTEENVISLNKLHLPYLISRSLDLLLKSDNERVLMSERIQSLKMMRHILSISPQHFSHILVRPLVSVVLRPVEETDRLLKSCIAILCELCILNTTVFIECDGVRALLRNAILIPSSHIAEAICGALLFLLNKPQIREFAKVDLQYLISGYTNSVVTEKNSFREEERRLSWTNFVLLTMLKSSTGIFELCTDSCNGLKSIVQILYLNKPSIRKAVLDMLYELINIPSSDWLEDELDALEIVELSRYQEKFKLSEGFVFAEGEHFLPSLVKNRVNLIELHTALLLICLLESRLPDALVEVIVSSEVSVSLNAAIFLGEFLNLTRKLLPQKTLSIPPALSNLVSYAVHGSPLQLQSFSSSAKDEPISYSNPYEQYSNFSQYSKDIHNFNNNNNKSRYADNMSTKKLDLRSSISDSNYPRDRTTESSQDDKIVAKDAMVTIQDSTLHNAGSDDTVSENLYSRQPMHPFYVESVKQDDELILNQNRLDLPPCRQKQRMALSAFSVLSSLQKKFEKPCQPVSLLLSNIAQYGEESLMLFTPSLSEMNVDRTSEKKDKKIPLKELEELIRESGIHVVPDGSRWKWETIRIVLKLSMNNPKIFNENIFKIMLKKLVNFYKPSLKKYSHTPLKSESIRVNIYTLVACDLFDILLDPRVSNGLKFLSEICEDLHGQLKHLIEAKSVHDCLLSPLRLTNSLSQDYFLLIGRLSNKDVGLQVLQKHDILNKLQHIATNINLDCYVKLIISSLSYVFSDDTRTLYSSVLSCSFLSSRLYATKYLLVLLRTNASKHESFRNWLVEMLVNQLYDENQTIAMVSLSILSEAADDKNYLDILVTMRPSLLHLGDAGLLLLIRFLSIDKGFQYLQTANFVIPQLQRWSSSFNTKYVQIVEGDLHDALTHYQRSEDGRYKKRITGNKARLKNVIVPPHLYGQLVQHSRGFELLMKQDVVQELIQTILIGDYDNDNAILKLKVALWAMGNFGTSSAGVKYLSKFGVIRGMTKLAETAVVYSIKMTSFYVLSMIATTKEGVSALNKTNWLCLKRSRHENYFATEEPYSSVQWNKLLHYDDTETLLSASKSELVQNGRGKLNKKDEGEGVMLKLLNKFTFEKKSATLPQRNVCSSQIQHTRSASESKENTCDDWSFLNSPSSSIQNCKPEINSDFLSINRTDNGTSGISSPDSAYVKTPNYEECIPFTLSPIPSTSSLSAILPRDGQKEYCWMLPKRHSSISFGCRLNTQNTLGYKTMRLLHNRHMCSHTPSYSASATIEYLSAPDRRPMSPLVRPKFPRYLEKSVTPKFEIRSSLQDQNVSMNVSGIQSSRFSHSIDIDDDRLDFEGPCYQGICLPARLNNLWQNNSSGPSSCTYVKKTPQPIRNTNEEVELSDDSDSDRVKYDDADVTFRSVYKRRRHDKLACLLCSLKPNYVVDINKARSRKTSSSSVHRIRTETESSYGGNIGIDNESPILLTWQHKPTGLVDNTPGEATCSTLDTSESQSSSLLAQNETSLKSRSIMRKEVLKLIEQLGNPVLYKTCKQGLLQLKQICGDLFQDICLFSDVCAMLGSVNYRIHARQLIQDLFLDAPFHELFEDSNCIISQTSVKDGISDIKSCSSVNSVPSESSSQTNAFSLPANSHPTSQETNKLGDRKNENDNDSLQVIIETDAVPDSMTVSEKTLTCCEFTQPVVEKSLSNDAAIQSSNVEERFKNLYDCRRAYSYPATNYVITGLGVHDTKTCNLDLSRVVAKTRSRSVSATCSYISEITMNNRPVFHYNDDFSFGSIVLDRRLNNLTSLFDDRLAAASVVLAFENSYNVLQPKFLLKEKCNNETNSRKLASFNKSSNSSLFIKPETNM